MIDANFRRTLVLDSDQADLCTETVELDPCADIGVIHHTSCVSQGDEEPFARVIWFWNGGERSAYSRDVSELEETSKRVWQLMGGASSSIGAGSTQAASGMYVELGTGVLAGRGRESVVGESERCQLPFSRNPRASDELEGVLSRVCSVAATRARSCMSDTLRDLITVDEGPTDLVAAYQYPRPISGVPMIYSNQVVVRRPAEREGSTQSERELACLHSVSNLHVDVMDGQMGCLGAMTQYACRSSSVSMRDETTEMDEEGREALRYRDLVVFPKRDGGRGVRIHVAEPGWTCLVFMRTGCCLHGGVVPAPDRVGCRMTLPEGVSLARIVTYPMKAVQRALIAARQDKQVAVELRRRADPRMRQRMGTANVM